MIICILLALSHCLSHSHYLSLSLPPSIPFFSLSLSPEQNKPQLSENLCVLIAQRLGIYTIACLPAPQTGRCQNTVPTT